MMCDIAGMPTAAIPIDPSDELSHIAFHGAGALAVLVIDQSGERDGYALQTHQA